MPSREYVDQDSNKKWIAVIRFKDTKHMESFSKAAIEVIDAWRLENKKEEVPPEMPAAKVEEEDFPF